MSHESETQFVDEIARITAHVAVKEAEKIAEETRLRTTPLPVRPLKEALLILLSVTLGIFALTSKPVNPFELTKAQFNLPKPVASNTLKDPNR